MARGQSPYQGAYGFPVQSTVEQSMARGAQAQAAMYSNLGRELGNVANTYFEAKAENEQIEAIASDPRILDMVYKGRSDMPADPKQRKKDVKALYREMGGRKGIEQLIRMDETDARNKEVFDLQKQAHLREKDKYERELKHKDDQLKVLKNVYFPTAEVTREVADPRLEAVAEELQGKSLGNLLGLKESVQEGVETIHSVRSELSKHRPEVMPEVLRNLRTSIIDHPDWSEKHKQTLLEALAVSPDNPYGSMEVAKEIEAGNVEADLERGRRGYPQGTEEEVIEEGMRRLKERRIWTSDKGKELVGEFVSMDDDTVTLNIVDLEKETEKKYTFAKSALSERDQDFIKEPYQGYSRTRPEERYVPSIAEYSTDSLYEHINWLDELYPKDRAYAEFNKQFYFANLWESLAQIDATEEEKATARKTLLEVLHPPEKEEDYMERLVKPFEAPFRGLASARRSLAGVTLPEKLEVPTTTVTTTERLLSPNLATTKEGMWAMIKANNPDMPDEYLPHLIELVNASGKPTIAQTGYTGLQTYAAENKEYFWSAQEAEDWLRTTGKGQGLVISEAQVKDFREKARIIDIEKVSMTVDKQLKQQGILQNSQQLENLAEAYEIVELARTKPAAVGGASGKFARLFEQQGVLTDADVVRLGGGSEAILTKISDFITRAEKGELPEKQADEMQEIIEEMQEAAEKEMGEKVPQLVRFVRDKYDITEQDVYQKTVLRDYMGDMPRSPIQTSEAFDRELSEAAINSTVKHPITGTLTILSRKTVGGNVLITTKDSNGNMSVHTVKKKGRDNGGGNGDVGGNGNGDVGGNGNGNGDKPFVPEMERASLPEKIWEIGESLHRSKLPYIASILAKGGPTIPSLIQQGISTKVEGLIDATAEFLNR